MNKTRNLITLLLTIVALTAFISCRDEDNNEPSVYDPAGEIEGSYLGILDVTDGTASYKFEDASFVIQKGSSGSVYYSIVLEDGKKIVSNIPATVGYAKDNSEYILAAINEEGTISKSGRLHYSGKCSVNGVAGYNFTFNGNKLK